MKKAAIYARVSTSEQFVGNQVIELEAVCERMGWQITEKFIDDGISGSKGINKRPAYKKLYEGIIKKDFDIVVAWSVDRLSRSSAELLNFLGTIGTKNIDLYILKQNIDTTTPAGKAMFGMFSVFAQFERDITSERIIVGLQKARRDGTKLGRPFATEDIVNEIIRIRNDSQWGILRIAKHLNIGTSVVQRVVNNMTANPT